MGVVQPAAGVAASAVASLTGVGADGGDVVVALVAAVVTIVVGAQVQVLVAGVLGDRVAREAVRARPLGVRIDRTGTIIVPGLLALASGVAIGWAGRAPIRRDALSVPRRVVVGLSPSLTAVAVAVVAMLAGRASGGADGAIVDEGTVATVAAVALLQAAFWLVPAPPLPGGEVVAALLRDERRASWERLARGSVAPWGMGLGALVVVTGVGDALRRALGA